MKKHNSPDGTDCQTQIKNKGETEAQQKIFNIAVSILGHDNFGVDTNLFYAGLTSISTLKFNLALSKAFGKPMKITDVKENNTIRLLEKFFGVFTGCTKSVDYPDVTVFESELNKGADLTGKTVTFEVTGVRPASAFGYNLIGGEHLLL